MKMFLLIAGDYYYPSVGTGDWRGFYKTHEEAQSQVNKIDGVYDTAVSINGHHYDWHEIINLGDWIK